MSLIHAILAAAGAGAEIPDSSQPQPIVVTGTRPQTSYRAESSAIGGFSEARIAEVPQSVQVITRDLIDDQAALSIAELLGNVASASNALGRSTPFSTGFAQIRGQDASIFRDGFRDVDFADIDTSALTSVERLEILKGPAGLVYGTGGAGGIVNIVTKRPLDRFRAELTTTLGTFGTRIASADLSIPLGAGFALRATGEIERSDGFIDFSEIERDNYALALGYSNGPLRILARFEDIQSRDDSAMTLVGLPAVGTVIRSPGLRIRRSIYLGEPNADFRRSTGSVASVFVNFDLSEALGFEVAGRRTRVNFDQTNLATLGALNTQSLLLARGRFRTLDLKSEQYNLRGLVRLKGETGPVRHDLTFGAEYFQHAITIRNIEVARAAIPAINVVNPVYLPGFPSRSELVRNRDTDDDVEEYFVHNVMRISPGIAITAGLRHTRNRFEAEEALPAAPGVRARAARPGSKLNKTIYQLGATYELVPGLSAFAGFNSGFDANDELGRSESRTGDPFKPETFEQYEGGIKLDFGSTLSATLAGFILERRNILSPDPVDTSFQIQAGRERTNGFEADLVWSPSESITIRSGYAYLDAKVADSTDPLVNGKRRPNTPRHSANAYGTYRFNEGPLRNLQLGGGIVHSGSAFATLTNTTRRPAFTLVNLNASYVFDRFRLDAAVSNVFDKRYFLTRNDRSVSPGEPRLFILRGTVIF